MTPQLTMTADELQACERAKPKKRKSPEHDMQVALFRWATAMRGQHPELYLLYAVPNGSSRTMYTAKNGKRFAPEGMRMRAEGMKAGVPDVCLPVPRRASGSLYIEMKAEKGATSEAQDEWISRLRSAGNNVEICRSTDAAIKVIENYLKLPRY